MNKKSDAKNKMNTDEILCKAISVYGEKAQLLMLIEEMEELYEALTIHQEDYEKVTEEIADVNICLKQAFMIFGLVDGYYPVDSNVRTFNTIKRQATFFVCRASRGREISPCPLFELAGWIRARVQDTNAKDNVQRIIKDKLARLHGRISHAENTMKQPSVIAEIGKRIITQDNRATDQPIFVVEKSFMVVVDPDYGYDKAVWVNILDEEYEEASETKARRLDLLSAHFRSFRGWEKFYLKETWEFVTACFTEQGCNDYLKANGHNLGKTRIYAYDSYRNKEYQDVRDFLLAKSCPN